jgi:L-ribulose-5-phosphate 3-epimerase
MQTSTSEIVPLRLGARAHDFGKLPADELAGKIAARGLTSVQLALGKAIAGVDLAPGFLSPGLAHHIGQAFNRHGVQIAVLGCYINPIHPDHAARRTLLSLFKEHLRYARDFGCGLVALETGSVNADYSPHPDNHSDDAFRQLLESIGELVAEAEKFGVLVGIEGVTWHVVSTPARMKTLLDKIGSNNLQVVFDPVNLLSLENCGDPDRVIKESFELFGDRIAIIHAKDFVVKNGEFKTVPAGKGSLDYRYLLKTLKAKKPCINVLLEEAGEDVVDDCVRHLRSIYDAV